MMKKTTQILLILVMITCLAATSAPAKAAGIESKALAAPLHADTFSVSVDASTKSGIAGSVVTYTFTVTDVDDGLDLNLTINSPTTVSGWSPAPTTDQSTLMVLNGETATFTMNVPIPSSATAGQNDIESITIADAAATTTKTINVTTTVKAVTVSGRPLLTVAEYYLNSGKLAAGSDFQLAVRLKNTGSSPAYNVIVAYDGGTSFYPKNTGGISTVSGISSATSTTVTQDFVGAAELAWTEIATMKLTVSYTDSAGTAYSDVFSLTFDIAVNYSQSSSANTTTSANQAQLVITDYMVDVDILQPGTSFNLALEVKNMGSTDAKAVTMVMGGGGSSSSSDSGTPQPGGVSGGGGELTNFAPLDSSNLVYIGDVAAGGTATMTQKLIVNVTTEPGVYTLKFSFVYNDTKGNRIVDDQVITLLVYSLPQVESSFYMDPGFFYVGTPGVLPVQVTNLGKKTCVLGNMRVTADGEEIYNNVSLVGALDPGGYYTLDAEFTPSKEGPLDIVVTINYTDDFNQPRTLVQKISVEVQPAAEMTPDPSLENPEGNGMSGLPVDQMPETFMQKIGRFFKGMLGLGSGRSSSDSTSTETVPTDGQTIYVGPKG
jgi:hypothetical protein